MRELENRRNSLFPVMRKLAVFFAVFALMLVTREAGASDETLGSAVGNVINGTNMVPGVISGLCYLIGLLFGVSAIFKLKDHVEKGDQGATIWDPMKRFAAGGALFALPMVANVLQTTLVGDGLGSFNYSGFSGSASGGGLDSMMVALIKDLWLPMHVLFSAFAYIAGLVFMMIGIQRLVKTSQDGPKGPGGFGTIMTFVTAAALFSSKSMMAALMNTIFGDSTTKSTAQLLSYDGLGEEEQAHITAVISAVLGFVALVGWISFIRGWLILRGVGEGSNQASVMAAVTHIVAGVLCVNLGALINAVQVTLGLESYGVSFS